MNNEDNKIDQSKTTDTKQQSEKPNLPPPDRKLESKMNAAKSPPPSLPEPDKKLSNVVTFADEEKNFVTITKTDKTDKK